MTPLPPKVLVSGASGFMASWIARTILEQGYFVRGTVRHKVKGEYLVRIFKEHGERFEYAIVEDIEKEGAFDDVVKGMDYIVHTASPFHWEADDPQELIGPAVHGTTSILDSILHFGTTVKRVVITSSTVAVTEIPPPYSPPQSTSYTEKDWNTDSVEIVHRQGSRAPQSYKYRASKVLAERAAWEFIEKHNKELEWDLVTLHPAFTFGPMIHEVSSPLTLNTSLAAFLAMLRNNPALTPADLSRSTGFNFVDVRDVAWAHAEALVNDQVGCRSKYSAFNEGKGRVLLAAGPLAWQDVVDAINSYSTLLPQTTAKGEAGAAKGTIHPVLIDTSRARHLLGLQFRPIQETFVDALTAFREKGWIS